MGEVDPFGPHDGDVEDVDADGSVAFLDGDPFELRFQDEPVVPSRLDQWRRRTATGAIAGAVALGLQQVFDPEKKTTIAIEQEAPDEPIDPSRIQFNFDPLDSRGSSVVIQPPTDAD